MAPRSGFAVPGDRLGPVLSKSVSLPEHLSEVEHRFHRSVPGCGSIPPQGFRKVTGNAFPIEERETQADLRVQVSASGRLLEPDRRLLSVVRKIPEHLAEMVLRPDMAVLGRASIPASSPSPILGDV